MNVDLQRGELLGINTWLQTCCETLFIWLYAAHLASLHVSVSALPAKKDKMATKCLVFIFYRFDSLHCLLSHYTAAALLEDIEGQEAIEFKC